MVILIGGASCTGKTTLAQRLLEKYKITYLSIDHIKMGLIRGSKYCDFTAEDSDELLTKKLWPIVKGVIMTNIENDQNIIIEGCYLPLDRLNDFDNKYLKHIVSLYIVLSEQYILNHFTDEILAHRSETEYKEIDDYMNATNFIRLNKRQKELCTINNQKYFEILDSYDIEIQKIYEWLDVCIQNLKDLRFNN